ncbi:MAG: type II secretion system minor pseudopilin GspK [Deltaproteobacteria bacterium]|nr:type II secretion system minor pseudopilin GspK [Deltaproteobacteria bacterium]
MRGAAGKFASSQRGIALVVALLITAIVVAVITEIVYAVHLEASMTEAFTDSQKASILAEGGVDLATLSISETFKDKGYIYFTAQEARRKLPAAGGELDIRVEDEQGKFPLNSIVYQSGEANEEKYAAFKRLLSSLRLPEELAASMADWIDVNDTPRPGGAEGRDYYGLLNPAYQARNASLDSLDEMLLVKGYTPAVFRKLSPYVTVYGDGLVNINTASREVIMALSSDITADMAQRVMEYREKEPFKDISEIRKVTGFETIGFSLQGVITVTSDYFRIYSRGVAGEGIRDVEAVVELKNRKIAYWRER